MQDLDSGHLGPRCQSAGIRRLVLFWLVKVWTLQANSLDCLCEVSTDVCYMLMQFRPGMPPPGAFPGGFPPRPGFPPGGFPPRPGFPPGGPPQQ